MPSGFYNSTLNLYNERDQEVRVDHISETRLHRAYVCKWSFNVWLKYCSQHPGSKGANTLLGPLTRSVCGTTHRAGVQGVCSPESATHGLSDELACTEMKYDVNT